MMRLYIVVKWFDKNLNKLDKLENFYTLSTRISKNFNNTLLIFENFRNEFQRKSEPIWDINSAINLLCTSSFKLPTKIRESKS